MTPPIPVRWPISEVASTAMRTLTRSEFRHEGGDGGDGIGHPLFTSSRGRGRSPGRAFPFSSLDLKTLEPKYPKPYADAQCLVGSSSKRVYSFIFHTGQRRRGSAGSESGTTNLSYRRDCSRTPLRPRSRAGPESGPSRCGLGRSCSRRWFRIDLRRVIRNLKCELGRRAGDELTDRIV